MAVIVRVRRTPGGYDPYGGRPASTETTEPIPGAFVAPRAAGSQRSSTEIDARARDGVIVGLTLYAPVGADITSSDLIEVDGVRYEVEGEPGVWIHPHTGWRAGVEVALRRVTG